jgi:thiamine-monophosphate kinase
MTPRTRRGEFDLIADLFSPLAASAGALGLKDDAALLNVSPNHELVITTDTVIGGVHFRLEDPPDLVARKALRVNLSDIAAKGAKPVGFVHAFALNDTIDDAYLKRYAAGLAEDIREFNVPLLGGDTTSGPGPLTITITAFGEVEKGRAVLRSGARGGDVVCVTGTLGDSAIGLACLNAAIQLPPALAASAIGRYHVPHPRFIAALNKLATACLDISDGLVADIGHLCKASGTTATIERNALPLSPAARAAVQQTAQWWDAILGGGDDYELAFTVHPERLPELTTLSLENKFPITAIGTMRERGADDVIVTIDGVPTEIPVRGFRHR